MLIRGGLAMLGLHKHHPFYLAWCNMKTRCDNKKSTQYEWYGGRGITYDKAWRSFENFYKDMKADWAPKLILDRKDPNGPYCKENCQWVTYKYSAYNRRSTKLTEQHVSAIRAIYRGGACTQEELAARFGISQSQISEIILEKSWA